MSVHDDAEIPFEAGTGCLEVARRVLTGRKKEMVIETESGLFEISFLDGIELMNVKLRIITYAELDRFPRTIKEGWNPLDEATLKLFRRGTTDGSIWFETDKMREWLFDFDPESMAGLCLLNAIYHPDRISLYDTLFPLIRDFRSGSAARRSLIDPDVLGWPALLDCRMRLTAFLPPHRTDAAGRSECPTTEAWHHRPE